MQGKGHEVLMQENDNAEKSPMHGFYCTNSIMHGSKIESMQENSDARKTNVRPQ